MVIHIEAVIYSSFVGCSPILLTDYVDCRSSSAGTTDVLRQGGGLMNHSLADPL